MDLQGVYRSLAFATFGLPTVCLVLTVGIKLISRGERDSVAELLACGPALTIGVCLLVPKLVLDEGNRLSTAATPMSWTHEGNTVLVYGFAMYITMLCLVIVIGYERYIAKPARESTHTLRLLLLGVAVSNVLGVGSVFLLYQLLRSST